MKLKAFVIMLVALGYLVVMFACSSAPPITTLTQESNTQTNSNASANSNTAAASNSNTTTNSNTGALNNSNIQGTDGAHPPHAVDISGKPIPESSTTMPDKPIILAKDSRNAIRRELKEAFDHAKHTTDPRHTLDGKTPTACIVCHHTEQPSATEGQPYLVTFKRNEVLTAKLLETSTQPVVSCRVCHFQDKTKEDAAFPFVKYPKETKPTKITNEEAYHRNCRTCHEAAKKRDTSLNAPSGCPECHAPKS